MMKKIIAWMLAVCLLCVAAACSDEKQSVPENGDEAIINMGDPLVIATLPDTASVPVVMANYLGYFTEEGVEVRVDRFASAMERDSAIQGGKVHGAISDLIAIVLFKEAGFGISATSLTNASQELVVSAASGLETMADLKGRTLALSEKTVMEYACDRILSHYGLDPEEDVVKEYIPQMTVRMEMLRNGDVDSMVAPEPQTSIAVADGATVLASSKDLDIQAVCLAFMDEAIAQRGEQITAFYRAYNRAVDYLTSRPAEEYLGIVIAETGFPTEVMDAVTLPTYTPAVALPEADIFAVQDWMQANGLLEKAYNYEDLVDNQFVR